MSAAPKIKIKHPIGLKWTIPEHRLREVINAQGGRFRSDNISVNNRPGVKYYLAIYFDDADTKDEAWIFLFIDMLNSNTTIEANVDISVELANYCGKIKSIYKENNIGRVGYGVRCCKTAEILDPAKRFVFDGKMVIKMEGTLAVEEEMPKAIGDDNDACDALCLGLWEQDESKDVGIEVDGKKVTAHKWLLISRSSVFLKMFESGMKEAQDNIIEIKDFSFDIVETAVKLLYHHSLVKYSSLDDKTKVLQFFDKYDIKPHKDDLERYLISVINEITVCRLVNAAIVSNALKLKESCTEFLHKCINEKKPIGDFDILDKEFALGLLKNAFLPACNTIVS